MGHPGTPLRPDEVQSQDPENQSQLSVSPLPVPVSYIGKAVTAEDSEACRAGQGRAEDNGVFLQTGQEKVGLTRPGPGALHHSEGHSWHQRWFWARSAGNGRS